MTEAARLVVAVGAKDTGVAAFLRRMEADLKRAEASATRAGAGVARGLGQSTVGAAQAERAALALAQAHARADARAGEYTTAIARLNSAMQNAASVNVRQGLAVREQIARYEQAAAAAQRAQSVFGRLGSAVDSVGSVVAGGAMGLAIQQLAAFTQQSVQLSLRTETAKNSLQALAGSPKLYADALAAARQQQILFGGSLADNIEGIQGLITVSRSSGVELSKLIDLSQRLSVKDPAQGIAGARIALNEALAGDPTSLAKRYEIPEAALAALRDEATSGEQKLLVIDKYLNDIGITSEVVGGSIPQATKAFNALNAQLETLQLTAGNTIGGGLAPIAGDITAILSAINRLNAAGAAGGGAGGGAAAMIQSFADGLQRALLTAAGFQDLLNTVVQLRTAMEALGLIQNEAANAAAAQAAADAANAATRQALAQSYADGRISIEQYDAAMQQLRAATEQQASATEAATGATEAGTQATQASAAEQAIAASEAELLAAQQQQLHDAALAAAQGSGSIEAAAARLASQFPITANEAAKLIGLLRELAGLAGVTAAAAGKARLAAQANNTTNVAIAPGELIGGPARRGTGDVDGAIKAMKEYEASQKAAADATRDQQFALANQSGQIGILRGELAKLTPGTAEYIRTQTDLLKLQKPGGGGGGKTPKQTAAEKEQEKLLKGQEDYQNKSLDAAREYEERLGEIAEEGAKARAEAQDQYELGRKRGAVGFYQGLAGMEDQNLARDLSARYEAAAAEAQEIARTKGADAAQAYLDAQRDAITAQGDLQAEIAEAEKDKDTDKAEYLRGLLKLQQDADAEQLRQVQAQGSEIAAAEAQQYAEAELRYAQHLNEMGLIYERKFGQAAPGMAPPPLGASPAAALAPPPTAAGAAAPAASAASGGASLVSDPATQAAIDAGLARVEGKLGDVAAAVGAVERRVGDVEGAVRSLGRRSALAGA